jgi:GrpB-like predicted nucleotidyltransferase (UPF0157 family)/predicted enzyme related to lactoylglutathione lyase
VTDGTRELRLVLTSSDYDSALHLYRDVLGLREEARFTDDNGGRATLLHAGRATLELGDEAHAAAVDALEVGRPVPAGDGVGSRVRVAFEVSDAARATDDLVGAGAAVVAGPVRTPWGSVNARLNGPDGLPLTVYANDHYVVDRPRLDGPVTLVEPSDEWPAAAAAQCDGIRAALGDVAVVVAHAGSTSVPGLAAKPILDLVLGVPDPVDEAAYLPALEAAGYRLHVREPEWHEHRLLRRADPAVNLHVFAAGDDEITAMLAFRDHLRAEPRDRELYLRTKVELAARTWEHVQDYADAKADVVADVMSRARPLFAAPVRSVWVVLGRTSGSGPLARSLATALGMPLLDADRVMAATGADDATASRVVAAMAADAGGAVLHGELVPGMLAELPGHVVVPPPLPDAAQVAAAIRQLVAG